MLIHPSAFAANYNKRAFKIGHTLVGHPLFELPRLVRLAQRLSPQGGANSVLYFRGNNAINQVDQGDSSSHPEQNQQKPRQTFVARNLERPALSVEETVAQIESCNAWMQLRDVGADPEYQQLLNDLMKEFAQHAEALAPGIRDVRADIFVSSPGATTPFHLDEEHNFLLQMRGDKKLAIMDGSDRRVLSEAQIAAFYAGNGELAPYTPELERFAEHVHLAPGEGVHIPPCYPHWVQNGSAVSISLGVLWQSDHTAKQRNLYRVNGWLRGLGLAPRPVGQIGIVDELKVVPFALKRRASRVLRTGMQRLGLRG